MASSPAPTTGENPGLPFGAELRRLRQERRMSLAALSALVHYSTGHLSKIENGRARPNEALACACDIALDSGDVLASLARRRRHPSVRWTLATRAIDLPPAARIFVGRSQEMAVVLAELSAVTTPVTRVVVIYGLPGAGKTEFAVQAAGRLLDRYAGGCLFLDLHGYGEAILVPDAIDRILRRLGVPGDVIPHDPDERAALYRQLMWGRRMLLVLNDPASAAQVHALTPPGGSCDVLVTSRRRLDALDEARHIPMDMLSRSDAQSLFRLIAGDRASGAADPGAAEAVGRITELCGRLPLAVRIAAARLRGAAQVTVTGLAGQLSDERHRMTALDDGERSMAETFMSACAALPLGQGRLLALLSIHPGPILDARVAAMLTGAQEQQAARMLAELAGSCFLLQESAQHYTLHDLVRSVAVSWAGTVLVAEETVAATGRLITGYLQAVQHADLVVTPERHREPQVRPGAQSWYAVFPDSAAACAWFDVDQDNLVRICELAAASGQLEACWKMAYAMRDYFFRTKSLSAWIRTHQLALKAARDTSDRWAVAATLNNLGLAYALSDRGDLADRQYAEALEIFRELGDGYGAANSVGHLAWTAYSRGDFTAAIDKGHAALRFYRDQGAWRNAGITLRTIALAEAAVGRPAEATGHLAAALDVFARIGLVLDEAMALNCLGDVSWGTADRQQSVSFYRQALFRARAADSNYEQARALRGLAAVAVAAHRTEAAARLGRQALALAAGTGSAALVAPNHQPG